MADGSITIAAEIDDREAEKQLRSLNTKISKLEEQIGKGNNDRLPLVEQLQQAQQEAVKTYEEIERLKAELAESEQKTGINGNVTPEQWMAELDNQKRIKEEIAQQEKLLADQEKAAQRLEAQDAKIVAKLQAQAEELQRAKAAAGELTQRVTKMQDAAKAAAQFASIKKSIGGAAKSLLKWGIGIRSLYILVRKLRQYITEAVKAFAESDPEMKAQMDELKAQLSALKGSWGAAFAPVLSAVIPVLQTLISWLTAAANAVAAFFSALGGKSTFKKAVSNTNALKKSLQGAGGAAKDAKKQLMGIDELNIMQDNNGGGGGGGGSASDISYLEEAVKDNIVGKVGMNVRDFFVKWDNLSPQDIFKKIMTGASMLLGGAIGFMLGGVPGAVIGATSGLILSSYIQALIFDENGELNREEIIKGLLAALAPIAGAGLGFALGGVPGAAIGMIAGFALSLYIAKTDFSSEVTQNALLQGLLIGIGGIVGGLIGLSLGGPAGAVMGFLIGAALTFAVKDVKIDAPGIFAKIKKFFWDDGLLLLIQDLQALWDSTFGRFNWDIKIPKITLPHLEVTWRDAGALARFFGFTSVPDLSVRWYAKGGVVDGATLIGAGEAGKEAIVPLERNTQWIQMVAKGLADILFGNGELGEIADRIAEIPAAIDRMTAQMAAFTLPPLPAVAQGQIVPPNAYSGSYGLSGDLADKLSAFLDRFNGGGSSAPVEIHTTVELDRRKVGEATYSYIKDRERGRG